MDTDKEPSTKHFTDHTLPKGEILDEMPDPIDNEPNDDTIEAEQVPPTDISDSHDDWISPIRGYIYNGILPTDKWAARKLKQQAARFVVLDGNL